MSIAGLQGGVAGPVNGIVGLNNDIVGPIIGLVGPNALGRAGGIVAPWIVPSAPSYVASAVHFDGNAELDIASLSCTDNGLFSFSFWMKASQSDYSSGDNPNVWAETTQFNTFCDSNLGSGLPTCLSPFFSPPASDHLNVTSQVGAPGFNINQAYDGNWHHHLVATNTNFANPNMLYKYFLDNVDVTVDQGSSGGPFQATLNAQGFAFSISNGNFPTQGLIADIADPWIAPGVSLLDGGGNIPSATRALFIDQSTLKPVNPSGFPSSAVLFSGDHTTFPVNQGTGGAFTLTGTLTNAATHP